MAPAGEDVSVDLGQAESGEEFLRVGFWRPVGDVAVLHTATLAVSAAQVPRSLIPAPKAQAAGQQVAGPETLEPSGWSGWYSLQLVRITD